MSAEHEARVLQLSLHGRLLGYLAGFRNGRNVLSFADTYRLDAQRPTFSLITHPSFPKSGELLAESWARNQRLHPTLSNLLPEGALRELLAQGLKVHIDHEFELFAHLGADLPGALIAEPMEPDAVPASVLSSQGQLKPIRFDLTTQARKFSLAGVQMKFSMKERDGRYTISAGDTLGDWIIKTPSTKHKDVPLNEYTAMTLATLAGADIPEIKLVELNQLDNLPGINLPEEPLAFAIRRFDRMDNTRIHMEDFAQVLVKYPHEKYDSANYEMIGKILYEFSGDGLADAQQFARRLLINILLGNGDAHLKNWSLIYADKITPRLSPAYDIVTTLAYIDGEQEYALNLGKTKLWYESSFETFQAWAERSGIPWRVVKPHLDDTLDKARTFWPEALKSLPMNEQHKTMLKAHWGRLHADFRILP